jgi:VWFA-related protein
VRALARCALLAALLAGGSLVLGQDQPTDDRDSIRPIGGLAFVDELEVTVVNIVAYVTDKQGAAVTNLTRDDFRIFHDGEERPISNFQLYTEELIRSYYQAEEGPPLPPAAEPGTELEAPPLTEIQPVWVMILIDNDNLHPLDRNRVLGQLRSFVRENTKPPVKMMVASTNRALKIEQEFTDDSTDILGALEGVKMTTGGRTSRDSARTEVYDEIDRFTQSQSSSGRSSLNQARGLAVSFAEEELNGLQFTFGVLREAVNLLAGLPGKKMILHLSNGLPMTPGIDLFYALSNAYSEPGMVTEGMRYAQNRQYDSLVKNANAQGVTLYTIGAGGLENVAMGSAEHHAPRDTVAASMEHDNYVDTLRFIAEETGGVAIVNANDIRPRLDRVEQDFYSYYSLGYNLQMSGADKVHQVKLTLPGHPDYDIRYQRRFVEKALESRVQDKVLTGLVIPLDENPIQILLETGDQAPASEDRWTVPFKLSFPLANIALLPEGGDYIGRVSLFIAARDTEGKQSDVVRQEHEVRVAAADYEEAQRRRFSVQASLLMEAGSFKVSVALLDQMTRQAGFTTTSVVVTK